MPFIQTPAPASQKAGAKSGRKKIPAPTELEGFKLTSDDVEIWDAGGNSRSKLRREFKKRADQEKKAAVEKTVAQKEKRPKKRVRTRTPTLSPVNEPPSGSGLCKLM